MNRWIVAALYERRGISWRRQEPPLGGIPIPQAGWGLSRKRDSHPATLIERRYSRPAPLQLLVRGVGAGQGEKVRRVLGHVMKDRRFHRLLLLGLALGLGLILTILKMGWTLADAKADWLATQAFLAAHPGWLVLALVILPGLPVPISPVVFLAGVVWHDHPLMACGICLTAFALNFCWTYWTAARPARSLVERWLREASVKIPSVPKGSDLKLILILRLTPGMPLFVQNYVLGFLRVPFGLYLGVSMACTGAIACGMVLTGAGVGDGNLTPILSGIGLLLLAAVGVSWVRRRVGNGSGPD